MGLQKLILNIILGFLNIFVKRFKIKENQVAFVSLESKYLDSDMKLIYDVLKQDKQLNLKKVVIEYDGIEHGISEDLIAQGVDEQDIVLAFLDGQRVAVAA